jgi:cytochrome b subunit of formate dehydrogenase
VAVLLILILAIAFGAAPARAIDNADCLSCHSSPEMKKTLPSGVVVTLNIEQDEFGTSIHGQFACTDCHTDIAEIPHPNSLAKVDCGTCHGDTKEQYLGSVHGKAISQGITEAPGCADCHGTHNIKAAADSTSATNPRHVAETCARCHANPDIIRKYEITARAPTDAYIKSVHGRALLIEGNPNAPSCSTCHPAHAMLAATDPASTVNRMNIPSTCGQCHSEIADIYTASIHGTAAAKGLTDSPVCTDCHGEHNILAPTDPASTVFPENIAKTTCPRCHESLVLSSRYGFEADRIATYNVTYHGLATRRGALNVANCASCHGIHNIFPSNDPRSTVNVANLQKTCGNCHPNASKEFASIQVHPSISGILKPQKQPRDIARAVYVGLLLLVIGGMAAHNVIIWIYYVVEKRNREKGEARVRRFSRFESIEHLLLLSSFFLLVFTGFALKYPEAGWVRLTETMGLNETLRGILHRTFAVIMIVVSVAHAGFLVGSRRGRRDLAALRPTIRDVADFWNNMAFYLRKKPHPPAFPRFDYTEKAEYLALIWGTVVMVFTGFVLWFPIYFTRFFPGWIVEVSEVVHFYEAWLAFLAIIIWHFFYVIYGPEASPMNVTWVDGMTTVRHALHKHGRIDEDESIHYPEGEEPKKSPERSDK